MTRAFLRIVPSGNLLGMTIPAPLPNDSRQLKLAAGWACSQAALWLGVACFLGLFWFSPKALQNNSDYTRSQIFFALPELLSEFVSSTQNPNPPVRPSGWQYVPERFDLMAVAGVILLFAWGWGSLIVRRMIFDAQITSRLERPRGPDVGVQVTPPSIVASTPVAHWGVASPTAIPSSWSRNRTWVSGGAVPWESNCQV